MWNRVYAVVTTLLTMLSLGGLLSLRFVGYYSHQALAVVLLLGFGWAVVSRLWLAWKGHLYPRLPRGFLQRESWPHFIQAVGRASFWAAAAVACLAVFPNSAEMTPIIAVLAGVSVLRIAASFLVSRRTNAGPTLVMAVTAAVLVFDLGHGFIGSPAPMVRLAAPFEGEWLVLQGGQSPLQNHHLSAYNQWFALTRLSHELSATAPDPSARAAFRFVGLLDVPSSTPPVPSGRAPCSDGVSDSSRRKHVRKAG